MTWHHLVKCLDIDDMTSPCKLSKVTLPRLYFISHSEFYRSAFLYFTDLSVKLPNLDQFLTSILKILLNVVTLTCLNATFQKIVKFGK